MVRRALIALALAAGLLSAGAPAHAAGARVTIANDDGDAVADPTYATTVHLKGRGFQSIKGGYGGIYVMFGTVDSTWRPSQGGQTGKDYFYVPDSESKDNAGMQKFVAFPGSDTESAANGGTIKADGTWATTLVVPGATFNAVDRDGKATAIDCRKVTCGVITIGAHGVANANNETFTPITFKDLYSGSTPSTGPTTTPTAPATTAATTAPAAPQPSDQSSAPVAPAPSTPAASPSAAVDRATAVVGRVLSFTAVGFTPGEQVVATFDDGLAAVGPLTAGPSGEIAGVLALPAGTAAGTHVLRLTGAASGVTPTVNFAVTAPAAAPQPADEGTDPAPYLFLAACLVVLAAAGVAAFLRLRRQRRRRAARVGEASHAL